MPAPHWDVLFQSNHSGINHLHSF